MEVTHFPVSYTHLHRLHFAGVRPPQGRPVGEDGVLGHGDLLRRVGQGLPGAPAGDGHHRSPVPGQRQRLPVPAGDPLVVISQQGAVQIGDDQSYAHLVSLHTLVLSVHYTTSVQRAQRYWPAGRGQTAFAHLLGHPRPVSYTHLDVYKRQQQFRLSGDAPLY